MRTQLLRLALLLPLSLQLPFLTTATTYDLANQTEFDSFNPAVLLPGDVVRLARGVIFYGQLNISVSNITVTAYGSGADPVISGEKIITGWTACTSGCPASDTWYATLSQTPGSVFINGVQATLARYPNAGYLTVSSATSTTLDDATITYNPGWTGAGIHIRTTNWTWENKIVTAFSGNTFTFSPATQYTTEAGYAYFLDNKLSELDADNEWFYQGSPGFKLYLKLPADPSGYAVTAAVYDYGINCNDNLSSISISDIEFRRQKRHGVQMAGSSASGNSITNCTFDGQYEIGANVAGNSITVSNCIFQNQNGRAIHAENINNSTISGNTLNDIGLVPGYGTSGDAGLAGIAIYGGTNNTVSSNVIDNIGYIGIIFDCNYSTCEYNTISNCMTKTSDGAGIKCFGSQTHHSVIRKNILSACNGDTTTTPYTDFLTSAIYLDLYCYEIRIDSNVIYNQPKGGIQINKLNTLDTVRGNVVFGPKAGLMILSGTASGEEIENCYIVDNVFYTLQSNGMPVLISNMGMSGLPGTLDSNYYCNPYSTTVVTRRIGFSFLDFDLPDWQSNSGGQDLHTTDSYYSWTYPENQAVLYKNETASPLTVSPGSGYVDLDDNPVSSFTLLPFYGKIVIQNLPLAVEWLAPLRATVVPQGVQLDWSTATEEDNDRFVVERSTDALHFVEIGAVKSEGAGSYQFLDSNATVGIHYYRLRQVDIDGSFSYSNMVSAMLEMDAGLRLFPNPVGAGGALFMESNFEIGRVEVFDAGGKKLPADFSSGKLDLRFLSKGLYLIKVELEGFWVMKKVVVH